MRMGKGEGYNHARVVNAVPSLCSSRRTAIHAFLIISVFVFVHMSCLNDKVVRFYFKTSVSRFLKIGKPQNFKGEGCMHLHILFGLSFVSGLRV